MRASIVVAAALALFAQRALAQDTFVVAPKTLADEKAVFATVESANVVPARARIGGTVVELAVKEGDRGQAGSSGCDRRRREARVADEVARCADFRLWRPSSPRRRPISRAREDLFSRGTIPKTTLDQARTAFNVASNTLKARTAERSVIQQQVTEGKVLAPTSGRVLKVPVTTGTVILAGETVATVAEQNFVLRLRVPERHARFLKAGDPVRIDGEESGQERRRIRHHPSGLSANRRRPRGGRCSSRKSRRLLRRRAYPRVGLGRRANQFHRAGVVHRHPLRHRLCAHAQGRRQRDRRAGAARARIAPARDAGCASKSSPDSMPATCLVRP